MAFTTIPSAIRVALHFGSQVFSGGSRFYLSYTSGAPSQSQLTALANSVSTYWGANLGQDMVSQLALQTVTCQDMATSDGQVGVNTTNVPGQATTLHPLPAETAFLINFKIAQHYRGGHPRIYLPLGSDETLADALHWDANFAAAVGNHFASFISSVTTGASGILGLKHVAVSIFSGHQPAKNPGVWDPVNVPAPRPGGPVSYPVMGYVGAVKPASQRKRMQR